MRIPRGRRLRLAIGLLWVLVLAGLIVWVWQQDLSIREVMRLLYDYVSTIPSRRSSISSSMRYGR